MTVNKKYTYIWRLYSLNTFFVSLLIFVSVLLAAIATLVYERLREFDSILDEISTESIPAALHSNRVNSQVNSLTYLIDGLTQSSTQPSRRIANREVKAKVSEIMAMIEQHGKDEYLAMHIHSMIDELEHLNQLIDRRLMLDDTINKRKADMYKSYNKIMDYVLSPNHRANLSPTSFLWMIELADIIATASEALTIDRINQVRQLSDLVDGLLTKQYQSIDNLPEKMHSKATQATIELQQILLGENGMIHLHSEQLRLMGRSTGRGHFVRNLVTDIANLSEFRSYELNNSIQQETLKTSQRIKQQIQLLGLLSASALLSLLIAVYMIRHRVVNRLNKLNKKIQSHIDGEPLQIDIRGKDEIADIARSFRYFTRTIEVQQQQLQELSLTDSLTGIANRRALDEHLPTYLQSAIRHQWPVSILLIDVDYFKPYNDNYGHSKGDACLQQIAKILSECKRRDEDFVARYGGEEFVFVLPQSDNQGAGLVATLLQQAIEQQPIPHEHSLVADHVTISIGIATFHYASPVSTEQLLKNADTALYEAKNLGRNRYVSYIE